MTTYSVLYAFGDSLSDAGNAYLSTTSSTASVLGYSPEPVDPPYFQEIYSGVTADVFSNGLVWTQDLAAALGLGTLAPSGVGATANVIDAALTPHVGAFEAGLEVSLLEQQAHVSGTNPYIPLAAGVPDGTDFAIGGALTGLTGENTDPAVNLSDLSAELTTFQNDVTTVPANALATVSMGGNDLINLLEDSNFATLYGTGTTLSNVAVTQAGTDIAQSVSNEAAFLGSLIALGITSMVVLDVPDLGQIPEIMINRSGETAAASVLSTYYNNLLTSDVATLNSGGANIRIEDEAAALTTFATGTITNITTPVYSGPATSYIAADLVSSVPATQDTYLFFDTEHPTESGQTAFSDAALQVLGVSCFAEGTRIRTPRGDRAVETLRPGDMVSLAAGGDTAIVWAGHRGVDCARHPHPANVWPVPACPPA
jgi:phospholipase/lecithinase/hemolysin